MSITDRLTDSLAREADRFAPGDDDAYERVIARAHRRHRQRRAGGAAALAAACVVAGAAATTGTDLLHRPAPDSDAAGVHRAPLLATPDKSSIWNSYTTQWNDAALGVTNGLKTYHLWRPPAGSNGDGPGQQVCLMINVTSATVNGSGAQGCDGSVHSTPQEADLWDSERFFVLWAPASVQFARVQLFDGTWADADVVKAPDGLTAIVFDTADPRVCGPYEIKGFDPAGVLRAHWGGEGRGSSCEADVRLPSNATTRVAQTYDPAG